MEIEVEYEDEIVCPNCKHKFVVSGTAYKEVEPVQNEAYD